MIQAWEVRPEESTMFVRDTCKESNGSGNRNEPFFKSNGED